MRVLADLSPNGPDAALPSTVSSAFSEIRTLYELTVGTTPTSCFLSRFSRRHARNSARVLMTGIFPFAPVAATELIFLTPLTLPCCAVASELTGVRVANSLVKVMVEYQMESLAADNYRTTSTWVGTSLPAFPLSAPAKW